MNDLTNKIAFVSGATSGIGEACARRFAMAGAIVVVAGRNEEKGAKIIADINRYGGGKSSFCYLDITDDSSIAKAVETVKEKYGHIDILVNNAGVFPVTPGLGEIERCSCLSIVDTNVNGTLMMTQAFLPILSNGGCVLNNASVAGLDSYTAGQSYLYSASKAAIIKITKLLAKRYGKDYRFNAICPGVIRTPLFKHFDEARYAKEIPMEKVGEPADVAAVANFLVSDDASYVNGAVLTIDGGQSL